MVKPESCESVATYLYGLKNNKYLLFYDNSCNLWKYVLYREPYYFKDLHAIIDSFHAKGHTNCPIGLLIHI